MLGFIAPRPDRRIKWWIPSRTVGETVVSTNALIFNLSIKSIQAVFSAVVGIELGSAMDPNLTCPVSD